MTGETNLPTLLSSMQPTLNPGDYVFCTVNANMPLQAIDAVMVFQEQEGNTLILKKEIADQHHIDYSFTASWITLKIHSSLEAVGLTAAFSKVLADYNISCNLVAGYYHDHIFVSKNDTEKAMNILTDLAERSSFSTKK
ncbi:MAG: ACT domain-containing protein [Lacibacter sp.]|jgi:hypothetical protein